MYQRDRFVCSQDMYDTLLPLFIGGCSYVEPNEACIQPMQVSNDSTNQPMQVTDADVHDALDEERTKIEESRSMPKWLVQTLRDSKLDAPLPSHVLVMVLSMPLMHQIVMCWLFLACVMRKSLLHLMRHKIQKIGWLLCKLSMMLL